MTKPDPLFRRIRLHAQKRLNFPVGMPLGERLPHLKLFLRLEDEMLERYHRKGDSGLRVAKARSIMLDVLLESLYDFAVKTYESKHGKLPYPVALLALGGYGREEVCPFSDVDLMFLYPNRARGEKLQVLQESMTDEILYPLWDLRLKIGHSTRRVKECILEAKSDDQTKNALLESRIICGSQKLVQGFHKTYREYYEKENPHPYVTARLADQQERRSKYGDTVFLQEPDIKNGVGGLRDYQNILWMAQIRLGTRNLDGLVEKKYLREEERRYLHNAYDFLLRVRNELHFQSPRATDLLNLERQPSIAWNLGFKQKEIFERVEAFMRVYYQHAQNIFQTSQILERRLAFTGLPGKDKITFRDVINSYRPKQKYEVDGFVIQDGELSYSRKNIFKQDPVRLLRVFRYAQQYEAQLDLDLMTLIRGSLELIDAKVINDPAANKSFRSILQTIGNVAPTLFHMHHLGVLGRFIPEFNRLSCLVQHEFYHRYTADIHTLNTLKELDKLFCQEGKNRENYWKELHNTDPPGLLYLMLLLHDIDKGYDDQSPDTRAKIATPILQRMGLSEKHQEIILFIIENHLEMARFWQRYDIDDVVTTNTFAKLVGDPTRLRYLYVHTFCDSQGTATGIWNSYKDLLHHQLFKNTLEQLKDESSAELRRKERKKMIYEEILKRDIEGIASEEIEAHFNLLPERYFLHNSIDEIELHLKMINQLLTTISEAESIGSLVPVINWNDDKDQGLSVINVITWDRAGLFCKLAGALTVAGLNILSTKAISRADHITIDTFYVVDPNGGIVQNDEVREIFKQNVEDSLLRNRDLLPAIIEQSKKRKSESGFVSRTSRLKAPIPPQVEVYHELSLRRTIIEIQATDHLGLLYQMTKAIFDQGFDITFARISTERGAAIDTFYIENINPNEAGNTSKLVALRETLNKIVASENFEAVV